MRLETRLLALLLFAAAAGASGTAPAPTSASADPDYLKGLAPYRDTAGHYGPASFTRELVRLVHLDAMAHHFQPTRRKSVERAASGESEHTHHCAPDT